MRWSRDGPSQHVAEQGMEVDPAFPRRWFAGVQDVGRLHHQMYCVWSVFLWTAQIEEGCVTIPARCFHGDVVHTTVRATFELAAGSFECAKDAWQLKREPVPDRAKRTHFSVVMIEMVISIARLDRTREGVQSERGVQLHGSSRMLVGGREFDLSHERVEMRE